MDPYKRRENVLQWKARTEELTERLKAYKLLLPEKLLQRGLSNPGELTRLETTFHKLVNGETDLPDASIKYLQKDFGTAKSCRSTNGLEACDYVTLPTKTDRM